MQKRKNQINKEELTFDLYSTHVRTFASCQTQLITQMFTLPFISAIAAIIDSVADLKSNTLKMHLMFLSQHRCRMSNISSE